MDIEELTEEEFVRRIEEAISKREGPEKVRELLHKYSGQVFWMSDKGNGYDIDLFNSTYKKGMDYINLVKK